MQVDMEMNISNYYMNMHKPIVNNDHVNQLYKTVGAEKMSPVSITGFGKCLRKGVDKKS